MANKLPTKAIRVGIIGLSAGGGWAAIAHLPYLRSTDKYRVAAICNSTLKSSNEAIEKYEFNNANAFDSVEAMCSSDTVDLVVCAVAVFSHYKSIKPAIDAGKDVYVEWPLGVSTTQAEELALLAETRGVRTIVGLQGRVSHIHTTLSDIIRSGKIGTPLVTRLSGSANTHETGTEIIKRYAYFKDRETEGATGQIMLTIYVGHTLDPLMQLLGEPLSLSAELKTTWPQVNIVDGKKIIQSQVPKTADDFAGLQGTTQGGVKYLYNLRGGEAFARGEGLVWDIIGDKGELRLTGGSIMLNLGSDDYKIRLKDYAAGTTEIIKSFGQLDLPQAAQNIGRLYENFATGLPYPTFSDAIRLHRIMDKMFESAETDRKVFL